MTEAREFWEAPDDFRAMDAVKAVMESLVAEAEGHPYNRDRFIYSMILLGVGGLMEKGVDFDTAYEMIAQLAREGRLHASYSDEEGLSIAFERVEEPAP